MNWKKIIVDITEQVWADDDIGPRMRTLLKQEFIEGESFDLQAVVQAVNFPKLTNVLSGLVTPEDRAMLPSMRDPAWREGVDPLPVGKLMSWSNQDGAQRGKGGELAKAIDERCVCMFKRDPVCPIHGDGAQERCTHPAACITPGAAPFSDGPKKCSKCGREFDTVEALRQAWLATGSIPE